MNVQAFCLYSPTQTEFTHIVQGTLKCTLKPRIVCCTLCVGEMLEVPAFRRNYISINYCHRKHSYIQYIFVPVAVM
jgi:hypothetical protein